MTNPLQKIINETHLDMEKSRKSLKVNKIIFKNYKTKHEQKKDSMGFFCYKCKKKFYVKYLPWWWTNPGIGFCEICYDIQEEKYIEKNNKKYLT